MTLEQASSLMSCIFFCVCILVFEAIKMQFNQHKGEIFTFTDHNS